MSRSVDVEHMLDNPCRTAEEAKKASQQLQEDAKDFAKRVEAWYNSEEGQRGFIALKELEGL